MEMIKVFNLGLRFSLELCVLAMFGYWGFLTGRQTGTQILLGMGIPIFVAVIWGVFLAPNVAMRLQAPWLFPLELILFGFAALALYSIGKVSLTIMFGAVYMLNKILMIIWRQ